MTAAPLHLAGTRVLLDPAGALLWPEHGLMAVADLHLEKGSAAAARGQLVPPWDTRTTLDRLALLLRRYHPRTVIALGDSFHDAAGSGRMLARDAERLRAMAGDTRMIWVLGNHDPAAPEGLPGETVAEHREGPLVFRHIARAIPPVADGWAEICGHHHPKASIPARAAQVTRPCFVADGRRVMLPAFGAYAGGLDVRDAAIGSLFPRGGRVFLLGQERLFSFALGQHRQVAGVRVSACVEQGRRPGALPLDPARVRGPQTPFSGMWGGVSPDAASPSGETPPHIPESGSGVP